MILVCFSKFTPFLSAEVSPFPGGLPFPVERTEVQGGDGRRVERGHRPPERLDHLVGRGARAEGKGGGASFFFFFFFFFKFIYFSFFFFFKTVTVTLSFMDFLVLDFFNPFLPCWAALGYLRIMVFGCLDIVIHVDYF